MNGRYELALLSLGDLVANPVTGERATEAARHRSLVEQAVQAEALGFHAIHLGEHHFSDYMLSSPPVVLAAIAERTTSLTLSTAVTLAGNLDPVRVAEDYATVDVLSGGRVELVAGRGSLFAHTYEGFGHPLDQARERYDESVALLHRLLREEDVTWDGRFRAPLRGHSTRPRPCGPLHTWVGAGSPASAELAARLGAGLMLPTVFGRPEHFRPIVDHYQDSWAATGRPESEARVGACSHTHVAPVGVDAGARWAPYYQAYWEFVGTLLAPTGRWPAFDLDELLAGPGLCGSPEQVVDRLGVLRDLLDLDRHLVMFDLGGIDDAMLADTIDLFGSEVLPHLV